MSNDLIGEGSFSSVFKGKDKKTNDNIAIKIYNKRVIYLSNKFLDIIIIVNIIYTNDV